MKSKIAIVILLIISLVMGFKYYQLTNQYETLLSSLIDDASDYNAVYYNEQVLGEASLIEVDDQLYISLDTVIDQVDSSITLSNSGQRIYIEWDSIDFKIEDAWTLQYLNANMRAINIPLVYEDDRAFVHLETISRLYALNYIYFEETNAILVYSEDSNVTQAVIAQGEQIYKPLPNGFAKYRTANTDEKVYVFGTIDGYESVLDTNGHLIYVEKTDQEVALNFQEAQIYTPVEVTDDKISLTWEAIESYSDNAKKLQTPFEEGINVISPTWFNLNVNGIVINSASLRYSERAHENGLKVWGLFKNNFDPAWTNALLESDVDQKYAIAQMLFYSAFYELDGVNFDFENIYLEDQDSFASFIEASSQAFQNAGLTVSIDVTRPGGSDQWSKVYDRTRIGRAVDYVCLMAYDEFWGSSPLSGPVASLPWTEESIQMSLNEIPASKLILGIPLYMRIWTENPNASGMYVKTGSTAVTMNGFENVKAEHSLEIQWDSDSEQYYGEYDENATIYRVWIEDETSITSRLNLADSYELPGIATWRRGYGSEMTDSLFNSWLQE